MTTLFTIGHSNRELAEFLRLLELHGIRQLVDVRAHPGSRRLPHFGQEVLVPALVRCGIAYVHLAALGGRRRSSAGEHSPNGALRNASFRAYADHMASPEFEQGLVELLELGADRPTTVMCAEAVPWRCHRWLISDALVARGCEVRHILGPSRPRPHSLPAHARVHEGRVTYPAAQLRLD